MKTDEEYVAELQSKIEELRKPPSSGEVARALSIAATELSKRPPYNFERELKVKVAYGAILLVPHLRALHIGTDWITVPARHFLEELT